MVNLIVAKSINNVIGRNGKLPWYLPEDLKHFRELTKNSTVIMGRKTYDSLPEKFKPLPNRKNVIISTNKKLKLNGCLVFGSIQEAIDHTKDETVFVIGGGSIYREVLLKGLVEKMYITEVKCLVDGGVFFPEINIREWDKKKIGEGKNGYRYAFYEYTKI